MSFIDTLRTAFKGGGGQRVPLTARNFNSPWSQAYAEEQGYGTFNFANSAKRGFLHNPVAQRAVRIVAEGVANAPISASDKDVLELFRTGITGQSLLEALAAQLLMHGNGFVQITRDAKGKPIALYALRPERITIMPGSDGWPCAYLYTVGERKIEIKLEDENGWPNIIHLKAYHPVDDHYGAGCLNAADQAVAIHNAASIWNRALLENAARPSGALVYENTNDSGGLTDDQFLRLKSELSDAYSGSSNAGRPMLLEGGLKWQKLSLTPADMDFAELKAAAARDIALAFGVPPMLLGLPGDNTYANYREANRALWRLTLLPLIGKILDALEGNLEPWFAELSLSIDLDRVPALSEDREKLWKQVSDADFLTDDEKRELLGLAPAPEAAAQITPEDPTQNADILEGQLSQKPESKDEIAARNKPQKQPKSGESK